jgi:hypothetical protein
MKDRFKILFEIVQNYYWPAMEPIYNLMKADPRYEIKVRIGPNQDRFLGIFLISRREAIEKHYRAKGFDVTRETTGYDVVIVGDTVRHPEIFGKALLVNVDHGPCFKSLRYRNLLKQPDTKYVVCAEGPYRLKKLKEHGLDKKEVIVDVGLPKLDPFFTGAYSRDTIIKKHNLDPQKKIVLYAPTYKPTSLFMVAEHIADLLDDYNVIVKLHPYSWNGKYAPHAQHRVYEKLKKKNPRLILVDPKDHDILPYLYAADTMISEASSVVNEFLALGRCGVIFDLDDDTLKHSDGQPLLEEKTTEWLKDSFVHINDAKQLKEGVKEAVWPTPQRLALVLRDRDFIYSSVDGTASKRTKMVIEDLLGA